MLVVDPLTATAVRQIRAENLARAALRGFFGDEHGFDQMNSSSRRAAVRSVERILIEEEEQEQT